MRSGFCQLTNCVRVINTKNFNQAALEMRVDGSKLNATLRPELTSKGLQFSDPKIAAFCDQLINPGFYTEWRQKYGEVAWALLEKHTGKLA